MSEIASPNLSGVAETALIALYVRAMESQRPDAQIKDEKAVALMTRMGSDLDHVKRFPISDFNLAATSVRVRELDRYALDFLARRPEGVIVHIGCGLDSRFERVDNGRVEWYDLDLPDAIALRRKLIGDEAGRYHLLGCSVLESAWLDMVSVHRQRPFLFLAEGVFMYLEEAQVKSLVLTLRDRFPGSELVFDAFNPLHVWTNTRLFSKIRLGAPLHWGIWHGQEIEGWGDGIHLLDEWGWLDPPEPRLARFRRFRVIPPIGRMMRIYHFQLGEAAG
jgi:O-methyltransferase involved in polyketide biosynthesis